MGSAEGARHRVAELDDGIDWEDQIDSTIVRTSLHAAGPLRGLTVAEARAR